MLQSRVNREKISSVGLRETYRVYLQKRLQTTKVKHMENELVEKQNKALNILVEAARLAQARGAFTLEQAALVAEAIAVFRPADQAQAAPAPAPAAEQPVF